MNSRNLIFFIAGIILLIGGVVLIIVWWPHVVGLFKGVTGMALALSGLLVLYLIRD